jgi:hypothetical protein
VIRLQQRRGRFLVGRQITQLVEQPCQPDSVRLGPLEQLRFRQPADGGDDQGGQHQDAGDDRQRQAQHSRAIDSRPQRFILPSGIRRGANVAFFRVVAGILTLPRRPSFAGIRTLVASWPRAFSSGLLAGRRPLFSNWHIAWVHILSSGKQQARLFDHPPLPVLGESARQQPSRKACWERSG